MFQALCLLFKIFLTVQFFKKKKKSLHSQTKEFIRRRKVRRGGGAWEAVPVSLGLAQMETSGSAQCLWE